MPTAIDRNSKPDTVFLCLPNGAGQTACATDLSQYRTNLTGGTNTVSEANSDRTAITCPREVAIVVDLNSTDFSNLVEHGHNANNAFYTYRVQCVSGIVRVYENNTQRAFVALPGVGASLQKYLIHWSVRRESETSVRTELYVRNMATGAEAIVFATHAEATTSPTYDTFVINSVAKLATMNRYYAVRVGRRFHATAEAFEDWVTETTPPATTQIRRVGALVPDRSTLGDVAGDGSFAGPAHLWSGHVFEHADRRLLGALVNIQVGDPVTITHAYDAPNSAWWRPAPGDEDVHLCISLLWYRPVPDKVNRARVRIFVFQDCTTAPETAEVRYRAYSLAGLPVAGEPVKSLTYHRTPQAACTTDHALNPDPGEWLDLGELALAIDDWGCTWLAIGVSMDEESEFVATTSARVLAVTMDPYFEPGGGGGLDIVEP